MPRIQVAYGPPGQKGVTAIMGVGADDYEPDPTQKMLERAGWLSVGLWALGVFTGSVRLRSIGIGAAAVGFGVRYLANRNLAAPAASQATTPGLVGAAPGAGGTLRSLPSGTI